MSQAQPQTSVKKERKCLSLVNFFNALQFFTWLITFFSIISVVVSSQVPILQIHTMDLLKYSVIFVRIAQTVQISEFIFSLCGCTGNNPLLPFSQIAARLITTYFAIDENNPIWILAGILIPWSIADSIRSLFNLVKNNYTLTWLRYSLFMILYPIGGSSEVLLFEHRLKEPGFKEYEYAIRLFQVTIIIGIIAIYSILLSERKKRLKGEGDKEKAN